MRNQEFLTHTFSDNQTYLLPFGQSIVDHAHGFCTNSTGELLWNALSQGAEEEALVRLLQNTYHAAPEDIPLLQADVAQFLSTLRQKQLLTEGKPSLPAFPPAFLEIGSLKLCWGLPEKLLQTYFSPFLCKENTDAAPAQKLCCYLYPPASHENGTILIRNEELLLFETNTHYILIPLKNETIYELHITKDGSQADLYCRLTGSEEADYERIFHILRFAFLITAQTHDFYVIHSASILYQGKALLFSGRSGAGKSTQAGLWNRLFSTCTLNGDLNLLGIQNHTVMCFGLPWCGTSGISTEKSFPLGGIIFLKQAAENQLRKLPETEKILNLLHRLISPSWTEEQFRQNLTFCETFAADILMFQLSCNLKEDAAYLTKAAIDQADA